MEHIGTRPQAFASDRTFMWSAYRYGLMIAPVIGGTLYTVIMAVVIAMTPHISGNPATPQTALAAGQQVYLTFGIILMSPFVILGAAVVTAPVLTLAGLPLLMILHKLRYVSKWSYAGAGATIATLICLSFYIGSHSKLPANDSMLLSLYAVITITAVTTCFCMHILADRSQRSASERSKNRPVPRPIIPAPSMSPLLLPSMATPLPFGDIRALITGAILAPIAAGISFVLSIPIASVLTGGEVDKGDVGGLGVLLVMAASSAIMIIFALPAYGILAIPCWYALRRARIQHPLPYAVAGAAVGFIGTVITSYIVQMGMGSLTTAEHGNGHRVVQTISNGQITHDGWLEIYAFAAPCAVLSMCVALVMWTIAIRDKRESVQALL